MTWTQKLQHVGREDGVPVSGSNYKGLNIYAAPMVHESMAANFLQTNLPKSARILVLGAGSGAFDERLFDMGYENIVACEFNPEIYKGRFPVLSLDLNEDFSQLGVFDAVIAIELIEHLENHFHFLRECRALLSDNGVLLISTPNPESSFSRLKFFLRGDLNFFSEAELLGTGHINPVFKKTFVYYAEQIGLTSTQCAGNASVWSLSQYQSKKQKVFVCMARILSLLQRNKNNWQIAIYSFKKAP